MIESSRNADWLASGSSDGTIQIWSLKSHKPIHTLTATNAEVRSLVTRDIGIAEGEAFTPLRALSFALIWGGAAVFIYGAWRRTRVLTPAAV